MLWFMRDRLISLTAAREPQPPQFRRVQAQHTEPATRPASPGELAPADDLQEIRGIGPVYEQALRAYGVRTFEQLAEIDAADLAEHLGVPVSKVADWAQQAKTRLSHT